MNGKSVWHGAWCNAWGLSCRTQRIRIPPELLIYTSIAVVVSHTKRSKWYTEDHIIEDQIPSAGRRDWQTSERKEYRT